MKKAILFSMIILLISSVSSFGVSSPYWEGHPLVIEKGQTEIVELNLQNMFEEDITVKVKVIQGTELIELKQDTFLIKSGTSDTVIPLEISIPKNAPDTNKTLEIEFKKIVDQGQGIPLGTGMSVSFDIVTVEAESDISSNKAWIILFSFLVCILIIWLIIKRNKNKILNTKHHIYNNG